MLRDAPCQASRAVLNCTIPIQNPKSLEGSSREGGPAPGSEHARAIGLGINMCRGGPDLDWHKGPAGGDDDWPPTDAASGWAKHYQLATLSDREAALVPPPLRVCLPAKTVT